MIDLRSKLPFDDREERDSFSVTVRNTTNSTVYANILGATTNLKDNSNAKISYSYNLAGESYVTNSITIQYKSVNEPTFQTATLPLLQQNIEGVVYALNQLGIGTWFYSGTNVVTYNNNYIFGSLGVTSTFAGQLNSFFTTNTGTGFDSFVNSIAIQSDGKIVVAGNFNSYNGNSCSKICRLNADGTFDSTFNIGIGTGFNLPVNSIAIQSDGKIIVGGTFTSYNGNPCNRICRLNADGTFDNTFNIGTGFNSLINSIAIQSDGKILATGNFSSFDGNANFGIVRINTNGSYDATFNPSSTGLGLGFGQTLAIQADGKIILGGGFSTYNGIAASNIVRINTDGSYDGTFNTTVGANNIVYVVKIQTDGKILAGGDFTSYNGNPCNRICRINSNSTFDNTFITSTGFDTTALSISIQSNSKILVGGQFSLYNGNTSNFICRLNADGTFDNTFVTGSGFDNSVLTTVLNLNNNTIICGGFFNIYDGNTSNYIAELYTITPA